MSIRKNILRACFAAVAAIGLAACGGGSTTTTPDPVPDPALGVAQTAAEAAAVAAKAAVDAQMDNMAADPANYALANNAAERARTAADAAAATMDTAVAQAEQAKAEAERDNAVKYAGMVADKHQANLDEVQRQVDVASARTMAMASYTAADGDATKAQMQADEAEETAPGSPGARDAQTAATAARTAADAAKAAHDAIMDGMTKAEADAQATEAAIQASNANDGYMTAKAENDDIQTTGSQITENNRQNAVTAARKYGGAAADNAMASATAARAAANEAKTAYDNAMAEYMRATRARTNSTEAKMHADDAHAAYMAAKTAADAAHAAYMAAKGAVDGVMDDTSLEDANTARDTAEAQEGVAMGHLTTAMTKQTEAEGAESKAMMYADDHVVGLLVMANAEHITTAADPNANTDESEADLIAENKAEHIAAVNTAVKAAADAEAHGGGEVTATYPYGEEGDGVPAIAVTATGISNAQLVLLYPT